MSKQMEAQLRQAKTARAALQDEVVRLKRELNETQAENGRLTEMMKVWKEPGVPAGWKLVPVEPTTEMRRKAGLSRGADHYTVSKVWDAMLAAAPAVQGEPVSLRQRLFNGWEGCSNHGCVVVDPKPGMMRTNGSCQCVVNASRSQLYMLQGRIQSVLSATPQPAEQQPAPDVEALAEALESLLDMQDEDCRYDHQGYCQNHNLDHVEDGCRVARAKAALAAHRKQGGSNAE